MDSKEQNTDEDLVKMVINGNSEAFGILIDRYDSKLRKYVDYIVYDKAQTEDIVQDTFIKSYENLRGFDLNKKFSNWIYRIAHNTAISELRKRKKIIDIDIEIISELFSTGKSIEKDYERESEIETVKTCLHIMEQKYKEVLILYYLEEKSYEEICEILKIPIGTLSVRLNRARKKLKDLCLKKKN